MTRVPILATASSSNESHKAGSFTRAEPITTTESMGDVDAVIISAGAGTPDSETVNDESDSMERPEPRSMDDPHGLDGRVASAGTIDWDALNEDEDMADQHLTDNEPDLEKEDCLDPTSSTFSDAGSEHQQGQFGLKHHYLHNTADKKALLLCGDIGQVRGDGGGNSYSFNSAKDASTMVCGNMATDAFGDLLKSHASRITANTGQDSGDDEDGADVNTTKKREKKTRTRARRRARRNH